MPAWFYFAPIAAAIVVVLLLLRRRRTKAVAAMVTNSFIVKPYLQLGNSPASPARETVEVHWLSDQSVTGWKLEYRALGGNWQSAAQPQAHSAGSVPGKTARRWLAVIDDLLPGSRFEYRLLLGKTEVFKAAGRCRVAPGAPFRVAIFGDFASGLPGARAVANRVFLSAPDLVVLAGDLVYKLGLMREYLQQYFPVINADLAHPAVGAPIMRSVLAVAAPGNHDHGMKEVGDVSDFHELSDLGAYYVLWSQPLNGPLGGDAVADVPIFAGGDAAKQPMLEAAGERFPRMANFSFDFGDSHWLMLDANWYMDWSNPRLRDWVEHDLKSSDRRWKFVVFHQPPFTTDVKHADEQRMRLLADIFEKCSVDVVFSGHNHAYERNHPLRFTRQPRPDGKPTDPRGRVDGTFEFDQKWDGKTVTTKKGVLYIVTGAGGAKMYLELGRRADPNNLPPYTAKLVDDVHSFTVCDLTFDRLAFRQLSADGRELDRFDITK